jgi:hypothetical protein
VTISSAVVSRQPTSHERMTGLPWDTSYRDGPAPRDIGQPQPAIVRLPTDRKIAGPVLDAGCSGWTAADIDPNRI